MKEEGLLKLETEYTRVVLVVKFVKYRKVNTTKPFECLSGY
jgi:hypothetical protein